MNPTDMNLSIAAIVAGGLPRESGPSRGLLGRVVVRADHYGEGSEDAHCIQRCLHYVFVRPKQYTQVWVATTESEWEKPADEDYTLTSNHDSGWRVDGMRSTFTHFRAIQTAIQGVGASCSPRMRIAFVGFIQVETSIADRVIVTG
jgi:hypothetical protein